MVTYVVLSRLRGNGLKHTHHCFFSTGRYKNNRQTENFLQPHQHLSAVSVQTLGAVRGCWFPVSSSDANLTTAMWSPLTVSAMFTGHTCQSNGLSDGSARVVPRYVRPLPGCGNQGPVQLIQGRTGLLCYYPQAPTWPDVSRPLRRCVVVCAASGSGQTDGWGPGGGLLSVLHMSVKINYKHDDGAVLWTTICLHRLGA